MALYIITIKLLIVAQISNNKSYLNKCNQLDPNFSEPTAKTNFICRSIQVHTVLQKPFITMF